MSKKCKKEVEVRGKDQRKHLLVDGFNIIHKSVTLLNLMTRYGWEVAVDRLFQDVRVIHDIEEIRVTLVLDGTGRSYDVVYPTKEMTLAMVFAPEGLTADGMIERIVVNAKKREAVTVATDDRHLGETVYALGGIVISANSLFEWIQACQNRQTEKLSRRLKLSNKAWKENNNLWDKLL